MTRYPSVEPIGTVRGSRVPLTIGQRCDHWKDARTGAIGTAHGIVLREATVQEFLEEDPSRRANTACFAADLRFYLVSMD